MYVQIVHLRVKPGHVEDFIDAFRINYEGTRQEPGNVQFDLLQHQEDKNQFTVYEVFESAHALAQHRETEHYKECIRRFDTILEGVRKINVVTPIMTKYADA